MKTNLVETSLPVNFAQVMAAAQVDWDVTLSSKMYDITFMSITDFLALAKSTKQKVALAVRDLKGNLLLAGIVSYHANEKEDMPGNWSYEFTFDEADLTADMDVRNSTDVQFAKVFSNTALNLFSMQFQGATWVQMIIETCVNMLKQWLDTNANEKDEITLVHPGYFEAKVVVENGEKIIAVIPDGAIKKLIKDDSMLEEEAQ